MSPSQPSKQKRASQNRAQRAALEQRKAAATAAAKSSSGSGGSGGGSSGGGGLFGRLRSSGGARPASGGGGLGGMRAAGAAARPDQPIGYRAALTGLLAAGASLVLCLVAIRVPVDRDGDVYTSDRLAAEWTVSALDVAVADPDATADQVADDVEEWAPDRHRELIAIAIWPLSIALALPVIGSFLGFRAVSRRRSGRVVNRAMFATLLGAFLTQGLFLLFLPSVIGIGIASFQIRKAEMAALAAAQAGAADGPDGGDVIDAEVVDAEVIEAEVVGDEVGGDEPSDPDADPDADSDAR